MTWHYGDILRLTDKFLVQREMAQPDPYRVMFVHESQRGCFQGLVVAKRDGLDAYEPGELTDLSTWCFELDDE